VKRDSVGETKLPKKIYVSGASIFLAGYNGEYSWSQKTKSYYRPEHFLAGIFISPSWIEFDGQDWILCRKEPYRVCFYSNEKLLGHWSTGITVCDQARPFADVVNSYGVAVIGSLSVVSVALFAAAQIAPRVFAFCAAHANDQLPLWLVLCLIFMPLFIMKLIG
jgi:hypothetical protein